MQTWLLGDACVVGLVGQASKEPGRPGLVWVAVEGCPEELPSVLPRHSGSPMAGEGQGQRWAGVLPGSSSHGGHWELSQDLASGSQQVWALI